MADSLQWAVVYSAKWRLQVITTPNALKEQKLFLIKAVTKGVG
jgi:hypothetical protein